MIIKRACPKCSKPCEITLWLPSEGLDSRLRQFRCVACRLDFYVKLGAKLLNELEFEGGVKYQ